MSADDLEPKPDDPTPSPPAKRKRGKSKPGTIGTPFDVRRKEAYLAVLRRTGEKGAARLAVNVARDTISRHRSSDPVFREAEEDALEAYRNVLADEVHRRAVEGVEEPIYNREGEQVGTRRKYSDRLLLAHLRRHIPEYREQVSIDQRTHVTGAVVLAPLGLEALSKESRLELRRILEREGAKLADAIPAPLALPPPKVVDAEEVAEREDEPDGDGD